MHTLTPGPEWWNHEGLEIHFFTGYIELSKLFRAPWDSISKKPANKKVTMKTKLCPTMFYVHLKTLQLLKSPDSAMTYFVSDFKLILFAAKHDYFSVN